jgi:hypothetical protein
MVFPFCLSRRMISVSNRMDMYGQLESDSVGMFWLFSLPLPSKLTLEIVKTEHFSRTLFVSFFFVLAIFPPLPSKLTLEIVQRSFFSNPFRYFFRCFFVFFFHFRFASCFFISLFIFIFSFSFSCHFHFHFLPDCFHFLPGLMYIMFFPFFIFCCRFF